MKKLLLIPALIYMVITFNDNCTFKNAVDEVEDSNPTINVNINGRILEQ